MILLDTTVLVYAMGTEHPLRKPCREVLAAIGDGRLSATTTVEVVQEFAHVRARRRGRVDAATLGSQLATLLAPLISVDADDLAHGLRIFREQERLGAFDSVLAATCLRREHITRLLSADRAFGAVHGLDYIDVASNGLLAKLE